MNVRKISTNLDADSHIDVINMDIDTLNNHKSSDLLEYFNEGAVIILQNDENYISDDVVANIRTIFNVPDKEYFSNHSTDPIIGYVLWQDSDGSHLSTVKAQMMYPEEIDRVELLSRYKIEPIKLESYLIDPVEIYDEIENIRLEKKSNIAKASPTVDIDALQAYDTKDDWFYLFTPTAFSRVQEWGETITYGEYIRIADVHISFRAIAGTTVGLNEYDIIDATVKVGGANGHYINYFKVGFLSLLGAKVAGYPDLSKDTPYTYTATFQFTSEGPSTGYSISQTVDPAGKKVVCDVHNENGVGWTITPNKAEADKEWQFDCSVLLKCPKGERGMCNTILTEMKVKKGLFGYVTDESVGLPFLYQEHNSLPI